MNISLQDVLDSTGGRILNGTVRGRGCPLMFMGISTDSRRVKSGDLFLALAGERYDGHDFVLAAFRKGASGAVVGRPLSAGGGVPGPLIKVKDTLTALGDLARYWRIRHPIPLAAITGSNGKTTTKEILASILSQAGYKVLKTEGNLNNLIGVPMMLFRLSECDEMAVLEFGANRFGEIGRLTEITVPQVGVITMISGAHLEFFKNLRGVARAKGELLEHLGPDETAVVNIDDPFVMALVKKCRARKVFFGFGKRAHVRCLAVEEKCWHRPKADWGSSISLNVFGRRTKVQIPFPGLHNVSNALAAIAGAVTLDETISARTIQKGLMETQVPPGRFQILQRKGIHIIDDSYNANPRSMEVALRGLQHLKGKSRAAAILGDMLELGAIEPRAHEELGRLASSLGLNLIIAMGRNARRVREGAIKEGMAEDAVFLAKSHEEAVEHARDFLRKGDWVLVKGSRRMRMEQVVKGLGD